MPSGRSTLRKRPRRDLVGRRGPSTGLVVAIAALLLFPGAVGSGIYHAQRGGADIVVPVGASPTGVPFGQASAWPADAGVFPEYLGLLFAEQPPENTAGLPDDRLIALGRQAGTGDEFARCVQDERYAGWTASVTDAASQVGVDGTPTVLVNALRSTAIRRRSARRSALQADPALRVDDGVVPHRIGSGGPGTTRHTTTIRPTGDDRSVDRRRPAAHGLGVVGEVVVATAGRDRAPQASRAHGGGVGRRPPHTL